MPKLSTVKARNIDKTLNTEKMLPTLKKKGTAGWKAHFRAENTQYAARTANRQNAAHTHNRQNAAKAPPTANTADVMIALHGRFLCLFPVQLCGKTLRIDLYVLCIAAVKFVF